MADTKKDNKKTSRKATREPGFFSDYGGTGIQIISRPKKKGGKK